MAERAARSIDAADEAAADPFEALMLHFFTNLALAQEANTALAPTGLGRTHHRILAIVCAAPGITVGELLKVLRVTHQNVRLPIKELINKGYLLARTDPEDRRQRRLHASASGQRLAATLWASQQERLRRAFAAAGPDAVDGFMRVHRLLLDADDLAFIRNVQTEPFKPAKKTG